MCVQELPENGADINHFAPLHGKPVVSWMDPLGITHRWSSTWQPKGPSATSGTGTAAGCTSTSASSDGQAAGGYEKSSDPSKMNPIVDISVHQSLGWRSWALPIGNVRT